LCKYIIINTPSLHVTALIVALFDGDKTHRSGICAVTDITGWADSEALVFCISLRGVGQSYDRSITCIVFTASRAGIVPQGTRVIFSGFRSSARRVSRAPGLRLFQSQSNLSPNRACRAGYGIGQRFLELIAHKWVTLHRLRPAARHLLRACTCAQFLQGAAGQARNWRRGDAAIHILRSVDGRKTSLLVQQRCNYGLVCSNSLDTTRMPWRRVRTHLMPVSAYFSCAACTPRSDAHNIADMIRDDEPVTNHFISMYVVMKYLGACVCNATAVLQMRSLDKYVIVLFSIYFAAGPRK
jgi:hypothetical protein